MNKKILAVALCVVLCFCMALPAFAAGTAEVDYNGQEEIGEVNITITGNVVHTYLVDIEFTAPVFTYSTGSVWDPDNYQYKPSGNAEWAGTGTVKIVNHSDLKIDYTVEKQNVVSTYGALDIEVTGGTGTIDACTAGIERGSKNATATFKVTGTPTVSEIAAQKLGEIKITISK